MPKTTAQVRDNQLYIEGQSTPFCKVGSDEWFGWLETATDFRYYTRQRIQVARGHYREMRPISVRREKRRQGYLWYANIRTHATLYKRYVGKPTALITARLDEVAAMLNVIW